MGLANFIPLSLVTVAVLLMTGCAAQVKGPDFEAMVPFGMQYDTVSHLIKTDDRLIDAAQRTADKLVDKSPEIFSAIAMKYADSLKAEPQK